MAGIWERVRKATSETDNRINIRLLQLELTGLALGVRTRADARLNIESELHEVLNTDELTDLNNLADLYEQGSVQSKLVFAHTVDFALNEAELGLITETEFRTILGLVTP